LILADVFGATPCNAAMRLVDGAGIRLACGVNVPMLWRALCYSGLPLDELVARAVTGGSQGVLQLADTRPQNQSVHSWPNDQSHTHHQQ
jgi:PTS system ascorbate-specific IIA component